MKNLIESIFIDDDITNNADEVIIKEFIMSNYDIKGSLNIHNNIVDVNGSIKIKRDSKITSLTNGIFEFGIVIGIFHCNFCQTLTSLEGGPKKAAEFYCDKCFRLTSLKGAPEYVKGPFDCSYTYINNLKYSPKKVGHFYCWSCNNLIDLEGISETITYSIQCGDCVKLKSLKGIPDDFKGRVLCSKCDNLDLSNLDKQKIKYKITT